MALTDIQQLSQLLDEKKHILITCRKDASSDSIASAAALMLYLQALDKRVDVVIDGFSLPDKLSFIKTARNFQSKFSHLQKFILSVDVKDTGVEELSYDLKGETLRIFITPKQGYLQKDKVTTAQTDFAYDLVITLDTPDLKSLGDIFASNTDLFYKLPIINIDHHTSNEHFGETNIIDYTVSTTAEVLYDIFQQLGEEHVSKEIATALLTAMIDSTRSFTGDHVKPHTLHTASKLMALGADRQYIINNLYRTKTVSSLKLWGQALANLEKHDSMGLVTTRITRDAFANTGATESDLYTIVDELIVNSPEAKLILLTHEHPEGEDAVHSILYGAKGYEAKELLKAFNPSGDSMKASIVMRGKKLKEVEDKVIQEITYRIKNQ